MSPYITLGAKDPASSHAFYQAVLATIGWAAHAEFAGGWVAYSEAGRGEGFHFWVCPPFNGAPATAGNGVMLGLPAPAATPRLTPFMPPPLHRAAATKAHRVCAPSMARTGMPPICATRPATSWPWCAILNAA